MGVHGLWQVLEPAGRPIALETLENKVLAVDVSLWLHQAVKGFRDAQGSPLANAHLLGLLQRVCKLLFYGVKPVFVFDGGVPQLKKQTLAARQERRTSAQESAQRKARLLLLKARHRGSKRPAPKAPVDDLYVLPPLPEHWNKLYKVENDDEGWHSGHALWELSSLDCDSEEFAALPAEMRHRALIAMQHHHRWGRPRKAPEKSEDFSAYQLQGLLRKRILQQRTEEARREMRPEPLLWGEEAHVSRVASLANTHQVILNTSPTKHVLQPESEEGDAKESPIKDWKTASPQVEEHSAGSSQAVNKSPSLSAQDPAVLKWLSEECSPNKAMQESSATDKNFTCTQTSEAHSRTIRSHFRRVVDLTDEPDESENRDSSQKDHLATYAKQASNCAQPNAVDTPAAGNRTCRLPERSEDGASIGSALPSLAQDSPAPAMSAAKGEGPVVASMEPAGVPGDEDKSESKRELSAEQEDNGSASNWLESKQELLAEQEDNGSASNLSETQDEKMSSSNIARKSKSLEEASDIVLSEEDEEEKDEELLAAIQASLSEQQEKHTGEQPTGSGGGSSSSSFWKPPRTEEEKRELHMREQELEQEAARQQRHAASLNDLLVKECQELLALLGQPYVVSPGEAEAQCAWLEQHGLSHGVVTDDSDAWLFGAQCVYRHLFRPDRRPMRFQMRDLSSQFGLDRQKLVAFALLCGSDYTTGVNGVGPVTAMEVLSEFKGADAISLLEEFRAWLNKAKEEKVQPGSKTRSHLVRLSLEPGFPSSRVAQAYLEPTVDDSRETFSWGTPDLDALRTYANQKLGWSREKLDDLLLPVLKRMGAKQKQTRMDQYLEACQAPPKPKLFPSKRLTKAMGKLAPVKRAKIEGPQLSEDSDSS
ncbi:rad2 superfamily protein mus201 isoform X1 [Dermacentor variabilis]|uniref:rad2 superfamily protein mus201 isoform X1 n=2 Tax=Dermacentor variabilis TaxID=34621 RepID=UPI003F5B600F